MFPLQIEIEIVIDYIIDYVKNLYSTKGTKYYNIKKTINSFIDNVCPIVFQMFPNLKLKL